MRPDDRVHIIGAGRLGQLIARVISLTGFNLEIITRHPVQETLLESEKIQCISEIDIKSNSWDIVLEATGSPSGFQQIIKPVRPLGAIVLKSTY